MDKKILLVADDDEMNRRIVKKFLKGSYEVIEAADGREAWNTVCSTHVDAMLLDIIMPQMDGLEVLGLIREQRRYDHIGILVATSTKEKTERAALSAGADDVVAKPYDPLVIEKRLSNILAMKEISHQRELLKDGNYEALLEDSLKSLSAQADEISTKIQKYTAIINANKDNFKLVAEITAEIDLEAGRFAELFIKESQEGEH